MLGLSSVEIAFVAVLALIVIGPRDLPVLIRGIGSAVARMRRLYQEAMGGLSQLEREIDLQDNPDSENAEWLKFLPDEIQAIRDSIQPHGDREETSKKYRQVRAAVAKAQQDHRESIASSAAAKQ